jgi:hypothetical protein
VLNLSSNVKILDLLKASMSLMEVGEHYWKMNQALTVQCLDLCILRTHGFSSTLVSLEQHVRGYQGSTRHGLCHK